VATVANNKCFVFNIFHRYALHFHRETEAEIRERKEAACKSINPVSAPGLEIAVEDFFVKELEFPKRPPWNFDMSLEQLEASEHKYFTVSIMFNL
jgi:hypothetical protein